jgi:hypothetical protein
MATAVEREGFRVVDAEAAVRAAMAAGDSAAARVRGTVSDARK